MFEVLLTRGWIHWLLAAGRARYDTGFRAWPSEGVKFLESKQLLERDPSTHGNNTSWRITPKGRSTYERFCRLADIPYETAG